MSEPMTPEAFCWRYAIGCLDTRLAEHEMSHADHDFAMQCIDRGEIPSPQFIRRVFPKPFLRIGEQCTLEAMQKYWRVDHLNPNEKSPVRQAILVPYTKRTFPDVDNGMFWYARYYDPMLEDMARVIVKNNMRYDLVPGMAVYIHGHTIAEPACNARLVQA